MNINVVKISDSYGYLGTDDFDLEKIYSIDIDKFTILFSGVEYGVDANIQEFLLSIKVILDSKTASLRKIRLLMPISSIIIEYKYDGYNFYVDLISESKNHLVYFEATSENLLEVFSQVQCVLLNWMKGSRS